MSAAVESVAKFWPRLGNVPMAKMLWEVEAAQDVGGVSGWCERIVATAQRHAEAHRQALIHNRRHFVPDLAKWVKDGDYSRKPVEVSEPEQPKRRFDLSKLEESA